MFVISVLFVFVYIHILLGFRKLLCPIAIPYLLSLAHFKTKIPNI